MDDNEEITENELAEALAQLLEDGSIVIIGYENGEPIYMSAEVAKAKGITPITN